MNMVGKISVTMEHEGGCRIYADDATEVAAVEIFPKIIERNLRTEFPNFEFSVDVDKPRPWLWGDDDEFINEIEIEIYDDDAIVDCDEIRDAVKSTIIRIIDYVWDDAMEFVVDMTNHAEFEIIVDIVDVDDDDDDDDEFVDTVRDVIDRMFATEYNIISKINVLDDANPPVDVTVLWHTDTPVDSLGELALNCVADEIYVELRDSIEDVMSRWLNSRM